MNNLSLQDINLLYDLLMNSEPLDFDKLSKKYKMSIEDLQDVLEMKKYSEKTEKFVSQLILVLFQVKNPKNITAEECIQYIKVLNHVD